MNILLIASDNDKSHGAFLCMVELAKILKEDFHYKVYVIVPRNGDGQDLLEQGDIPYTVVKSYNWLLHQEVYAKKFVYIKNCMKRFFNIIPIYKIRKIIRENEIDIVHINTIFTYVGAIAALKEKIPLVWHIREAIYESMKLEMWNPRWGYSLMNQSSEIICISEYVSYSYNKYIDTKKLNIIYDGVDASRFCCSEHYILCQNTVRFLMVGALEKHKGQMQAIEAINKLRNLGIRNIYLQIIGVGSGEYATTIENYIREHNLVSCVEMCGYRDNVNEYMKNADVFLMCSNGEGFGRVTVEAMMSGTLVIGANDGATPELISHNETGLLYELGNTDDLIEKIRYVLQNRTEAQRMAQAGQVEISNAMTVEKNAQLISNIYKSLGKKEDILHDN